MDDILNRQDFIEKLKRIIINASNSKQSLSFAINGVWGSGKTFIVNELESQLEIEQDEATASDRFFVFHYNCWQYDYYDEPLIAIVSSINEQINGKFDATKDVAIDTAKRVIKQIAGTIVESKIGINIIELASEAMEKEGTHSFDELYGYNKTIYSIREGLQEISNTRTIVIVVDELDRCLPEYAIKVLERLHHLFNGIDNCIVVFPVDDKQLEGSVSRIYGENVDVEGYLKKFMDFRFNLDAGEISEGFEKKFDYYLEIFKYKNENERKSIIETIIELFNVSNIDIRSQIKIINKAKTIHSLLLESEKRDLPCVLLFEMLLLIAIHVTNETVIGKDGQQIPTQRYRKNLEWIVTINKRGTDETLESVLGKPLYNLLKTLEKQVGNGATVKMGGCETLRVCDYGPLDAAFYSFEQIYVEKQYYATGSKYQYLDDIADICKTFEELARIMQ